MSIMENFSISQGRLRSLIAPVSPYGAPWTCPPGVTQVLLTGFGGGGGAGGASGSGSGSYGGNGGCGAPYLDQLVAVTPGQVYTLTAGLGGAGGAIGASGSNGADSTFATTASTPVVLCAFPGGYGGTAGNTAARTSGGRSPDPFTLGGVGGIPNVNSGSTPVAAAGNPSRNCAGGAAGTVYSNGSVVWGGGGGGGGGPLGTSVAGSGGSYNVNGGVPGVASLGAGGGGGSGGNTGGAGGGGQITLSWVE